MAQRVAAIFRSRDAAERAADTLVNLGADRSHISMLARGEDGKVTSSATGLHEGGDLVEPAREVGDSGAALTTTDTGDAAKGAAIGAAAGLAAGLLALTVPGIGLVLAAGPLAAAMAGGAIAGGVYGGLRDIGIEERQARGYEERIRGGHVLFTALVPNLDQQRVRELLVQHGAEDVSFAQDTRAARMTAASTATAGEVRVPVREERAEVRKEEREVGQVGIRKEVDVETQRISEPVTQTRVVAERRAVPEGEQYRLDPNATTLREGETLRVPVVKEELKVEKVPRVTEEVVLRKETTTEQEERDIQLRRERVEIEEEGEAEVENVAPNTPRRNS